MRVDPVKTARIATIASIVATVGIAGWLGVRWLGSSRAAPKILTDPGIVAQIRAKRPTGPTAQQKESALVGQARLFALGINPPPPPRPEPRERTKPVAKAPTPTAKAPTAPVPVTPRFSAKSKLLATAVYPDRPSKSLALLDMGNVIGLKWLRVGDELDHQVVQEIHEDRIILAQGGATETLGIQAEPKSGYRSLLAEDNPAAATTSESGSATTVSTAPTGLPQPTATASRTTPVGPDASSRTLALPPSLSSRSRAIPPRPGSTLSVPTGPGTGRTYRAGPAAPTVEQRRKMADQNITDIKKLIQEAEVSPAASEEEKARERELWDKLLQIMEEEKKRIEALPPAEQDQPVKQR